MHTPRFGDRVRILAGHKEADLHGRTGTCLGRSSWPGLFTIALDVIESDDTAKPRALIAAENLEEVTD